MLTSHFHQCWWIRRRLPDVSCEAEEGSLPPERCRVGATNPAEAVPGLARVETEGGTVRAGRWALRAREGGEDPQNLYVLLAQLCSFECRCPTGIFKEGESVKELQRMSET